MASRFVFRSKHVLPVSLPLRWLFRHTQCYFTTKKQPSPVKFLLAARPALVKLADKPSLEVLQSILGQAASAVAQGQLIDLGTLQQLHEIAYKLDAWQETQHVMEITRACGISPSQRMLLRQWQACIVRHRPQEAVPWVKQLLAYNWLQPEDRGAGNGYSSRAVQLQRLLGVWLHALLGELHGQRVSHSADQALLLAVEAYLLCSVHAASAILQQLRGADTSLAVHERLWADKGPLALTSHTGAVQAFETAPGTKSSVGDGFSDLLYEDPEQCSASLPALQTADAVEPEPADETTTMQQAAVLLQALQSSAVDGSSDDEDEVDAMAQMEQFSREDPEMFKASLELEACAAAAAARCSDMQTQGAHSDSDDEAFLDGLPQNAVGRLFAREVLRFSRLGIQHCNGARRLQLRGPPQGGAQAAKSLHCFGSTCLTTNDCSADSAMESFALPAVLVKGGAFRVPQPAVQKTCQAVRLAPMTSRSITRSFLDQVKRIASAELDAIDAGMPHALRRGVQKHMARIAKRDAAMLHELIIYECAHAALLPPNSNDGVVYGLGVPSGSRGLPVATHASPPLHLRQENSWLTGGVREPTQRAAGAAVAFREACSGIAPPAQQSEGPPSFGQGGIWHQLSRQPGAEGEPTKVGPSKLDAQDVLSLLGVPPCTLLGRASADVLAEHLLDQTAVRTCVRALVKAGNTPSKVLLSITSDSEQHADASPSTTTEFTVELPSGALSAPLRLTVRQQLHPPRYDFHASRATAADWISLNSFWPSVCVPQSQIMAAAARVLCSKSGPE